MKFQGKDVEHYFCSGCGDEFIAESAICPDCRETSCVVPFEDHLREVIFGASITGRLSGIESRLEKVEREIAFSEAEAQTVVESLTEKFGPSPTKQ